MDFDDFEQENQNCNYADDDYDQGNDPEITSVTRTVNEALKSAPAKRQKSRAQEGHQMVQVGIKPGLTHVHCTLPLCLHRQLLCDRFMILTVIVNLQVMLIVFNW